MTVAEGVIAITLYEDAESSLAQVRLRGLGAAVCNLECSLTYEVLCGEGVMAVAGELYELRPGMVVEIAPGQAYQDAGEVLMLAHSRPPFRIDQVVRVEPQLPLALHEQIALEKGSR